MTDVSPSNTSVSLPESDSGKLPALDPRFECPICLNCLKDPFLTSCGHRFCKECIIQWMKRQGGVCPIDGYGLSMESDLFPDNYTRREIAQQRLQCPVEECTQVLSLLDAEQHMSEYHPTSCEDCMRCSFHNVGCNFIAMSLDHMKMHLNNNLHNHLSLISSVCSGLSSRLVNSNAVTSKAEEAKLWDPQPKQDDTDSSSSTEESRLKELVRNLFERIVLLEQKTREQDVQLSGAHQRIVRLSVEIDRMKSDLPLRICNGVYVWNISDFRSKLQKMKMDPSIMFYSPGFYTSYNGYRFCARLNLNISDTSFITLNVHLMQGENDNVLQWPFNGRISLTLVHPQDPSLTISETMMSRPDLDAFKRPTKDINSRAFGYAEFVSVSCIESYLENDCLTLQIQIKSV